MCCRIDNENTKRLDTTEFVECYCRGGVVIQNNSTNMQCIIIQQHKKIRGQHLLFETNELQNAV